MRQLLSNKRWDEDRLVAERRDVLATWHTGSEVDLDEAVAYHRGLPRHKVAAHVVADAAAEGRILAQPRHGATLVEEQIDAMLQLQDAGADLLSVLADAYTRQLRYEDAERALQQSRAAGRSLICGYPVVSWGVRATRRIVEAVDRPCTPRMACQDPRLAKEIQYAAGFTYALPGGVQNLGHERDARLELLIENYQYEDRLLAYYEEHGAPMIKELCGTLTGTLVPPCIGLTTSIVDTLLAVEQGVKHVILNYGCLGNLVQDVAALRVLAKLGREYVDRFGHADVDIYTVAPQWMGNFPQDTSQAYAVICECTTHGALAPANMIVTKSLDEAFGVPTIEANVAGVKATKQVLKMLRGQRLGSSPELEQEMALIEAETRAILERTLDLGDGDVAIGIVKALAAGSYDVPFSPNKHNAGKMMPVRDVDGAVRLLSPGNLPLPRDVLEFHREKVRERAERERRDAGYQMLIDDIMFISQPLVA